MNVRRPVAVVGVVICATITTSLLVGLAHAEQRQQSQVLCTHRSDRPDLGTPVRKSKGGRGEIQHRLPNGTHVSVLKAQGSWRQIRYNDPSPEARARSEPRRFTGWVTEEHLGPCVAVLKILGTLEPIGGTVADVLGGADLGPDLDEVFSKVEGISVARPPSESVKVCWWNNRRLGHGEVRDWSASARALEGCTVVGLGDVTTAEAPSKLAATIGPSWKVVTSTKSVGTKGDREHYAVVYDAARTKVVESEVFYPDPGDRRSREPWAVTLKTGSFDFTLVLSHVVWGEAAAERVAELERVDDVYQWYQDRDPSEQDVIIAGDLRRAPEQEGREQVRQLGLELLVRGAGSTITTKGRTVSLYDEIIIDPRHTKEWTSTAGVATDVGMELSAFRKTLGDHLPVWATFETSGPDDD